MKRNWQVVYLMNLLTFARHHRWTKQMLVEIKRTQCALIAEERAPTRTVI